MTTSTSALAGFRNFPTPALTGDAYDKVNGDFNAHGDSDNHNANNSI